VLGDGMNLFRCDGSLIVRTDIFNDGGTGISVDNKGPPATALCFTTHAGSNVNTINGAATFIDPARIDLQFDRIACTDARGGAGLGRGVGVTLDRVTGRFRAKEVVVNGAERHGIQVLGSPDLDVRIDAARVRDVGGSGVGEILHVSGSEGASIDVRCLPARPLAHRRMGPHLDPLP